MSAEPDPYSPTVLERQRDIEYQFNVSFAEQDTPTVRVDKPMLLAFESDKSIDMALKELDAAAIHIYEMRRHEKVNVNTHQMVLKFRKAVGSKSK